MPDITALPAHLTTLIIESFLYGLLLLFISTIYFLATQRTLAGTTHSAKHHFTSLVFFGVTALFLVVTVNLSRGSEVVKQILLGLAAMLGDALVTYRLWIIWGRNRLVVVFPILALVGLTGYSRKRNSMMA
ncbi:hypothetical protein B0H13DRAFT_2496785 [Mycena leptocephala]|nr:hypothetical protein B0H13DRAFT_2496785 [Mycena leptocephala]